MGKDSSIEWTHHTFNAWWGCTRVSPACDFCYAESWAKRVGMDLWGNDKARRFFSDAHWREPLKWNREAEKNQDRRRVFCSSMADVFESRADLDPIRQRLWALIDETPWLDWLLLTKRPQNIIRMAPWGADWPLNVWIGTTVENQPFARKRLPHLLKHAAVVRFVSAEPLLGPLDLTPWFSSIERETGNSINWVIAGGESGAKARPMNPTWAESLRDQCQAAGVAFHFKQWGHWGPHSGPLPKKVLATSFDAEPMPHRVYRLGKHVTGRVLAGRTWDEYPLIQAPG